MARMYPAQIFEGTRSPGELEIFRRLKDDPLTSNWIVLHSLNIAEHRSQVAGEIDFVIIVPFKGVLCLEVKAARRVRCENGLWYYGLNNKADPRGPFKQVSEAMHSMRTRLVNIEPQFSSVVYYSAVIFPYIDFTLSSSEWHTWQVADNRQFRNRSMGQIVLDVLDRAREFLSKKAGASWFDPAASRPDSTQCDRIAKALRPDFEVFETPASRAKSRAEELARFTQEQFDALDTMQDNPRVIFTGPAGTGKTLLAIEAARRSTAENRRVLLLCYNRLLGSWLREYIASLQAGIAVSTLHAYMLSTSGIEPADNPPSSFWEKDLPAQAIDRLLAEDDSNHLFDEVIIDEAQDILKGDYLDFLDLSLKGGLASGRWRLFGDFEKQAIYGSDSDATHILKNRFRDIPKCALRVNCRNTPRIAELVHLLGSLHPPYSRIRRPDNQVEPGIVLYRDTDHQLQQLATVLSKLRSEGFADKDIVILSPRSDSTCAAARIEGGWQKRLKPARSTDAREHAIYCSIHSFKGLEAPAVVVTDVDQIGTDGARALFYIAITRALDRLAILVNQSARKDMLEVLATLSSQEA